MRSERLIKIVTDSFKKFSNHICFKYKDLEYTYADIDAQITQLSDAIAGLDIKIEMPIGLYFKNVPEFPIGYYALVKQNIVAMLVDHSLKREELEVIVKSCHLAGFLVHKDEKLLFSLKDKFEIQLEIGNFVLFYTVQDKYNISYVPEKLDNITSCRFSSGTTGEPKCMMYTQDNIIAAATNWKNTIDLTQNDKILCVANYTHGLAFNTSLLAPIMVGAQVHLIDTKMPRRLAKYIQDFKITKFVAFPVLYQLMADEELKSKYDLTSLRICVSSGTVLHEEIKQRFQANCGIFISDLYGVAETGLCILNMDNRKDSIGKPIQGPEVEIIDEQGNILPCCHQGQIAIKSASMAQGYYNYPGLFEKNILNGYYVSGDIAVKDSEGYFTIKGRNQDFVNVAGKKVDPKEVEEVILHYSQIEDVAVYGVMSKKTNMEVLCCAIVSDNDINIEELKIFLQEKLSSYKLPQRIYKFNQLPRNASGKVLRRQLIEMTEC